jgi:hypothetical protein
MEFESQSAASSVAKLYEDHARDCTAAAGKTDNPKYRALLLKMAREWMQEAHPTPRPGFMPLESR